MQFVVVMPLVALLLLLTHVLWRLSHIQRVACFHATLYTLSGVLLLLRTTLALAAALLPDPNGGADALALLWLAEAPNAVFAALYAHLALVFAATAHTQRWPLRTVPTCLAVTCSSFCVLLVALTLLVAWLESTIVRTPQQLTAARRTYTAFVWTLLALLLLKSQAQCTQFLWRERRQYRRRALSATALHALAVSSTTLALLLLARALVTLFVLSRAGENEEAENARRVSASALWKRVVVEALGWELAAVGGLAYLLWKVPVEPKALGDQLSDRTGASVVVVFRVPTLADIVDEYVVATWDSLHIRRCLARYDGLFDGDDDDCNGEDGNSDKRLLRRALLADDYLVGGSDAEVITRGDVGEGDVDDNDDDDDDVSSVLLVHS